MARKMDATLNQIGDYLFNTAGHAIKNPIAPRSECLIINARAYLATLWTKEIEKAEEAGESAYRGPVSFT